MKNSLLIALAFICCLNSCIDPAKQKTSISVVDNNRHYYPILSGQKLEIIYPIKNIGKYPLMVSDIITSCGCLVLSESVIKNIPAGEEGFIRLTYNSTKNVGYAKHFITLYGNFLTSDKQELIFDVNVVPDALYTKDYEELYQEYKEKYGDIKTAVDGNASNQGYYLGQP